MSIARLIIYGSLADVMQAVQQGVTLNEIDEYGYTPLIQTAIVNDIEKARVLLTAGAEVDFTDLTGRTALHWTADNGNVDFSELLLKHKADPNSYTRAGQPVLVMPLLRRHDQMKELLCRYGASLDFAQDFINAKILGHCFELEGRVDIVDTHNTFIEMEFEGFYLEFNLAIVANSLSECCRNFGGKQLRPYFPEFQKIIDILLNANALLRYQHYLTEISSYEKEINALLNKELLLIPVACDGHALCFVRYKDLLIRCDRGQFGKEHGTVILYKMSHPNLLNPAMIKELLYKRQSQAFIDKELLKRLKLRSVMQLPMAVQLTGNCSWANVEAVVPACLFLFLLEKEELAGKSKNLINAIASECKDQAFSIYEDWIRWDKNRALHFCMDSFYHAKSPARKASKAAILAAILFQRYNYDTLQDRQKAERILSILTLPKYVYILKSYVMIFSQDKEDERFVNLANFLDDLGINVQQFKEPF